MQERQVEAACLFSARFDLEFGRRWDARPLSQYRIILEEYDMGMKKSFAPPNWAPPWEPPWHLDTLQHFSQQVYRIIWLEGAGPLARCALDTTKHMRRAHIEKRLGGNVQLYGNNAKGPRVYPSVHKAAKTRQASATMVPGKQ